jgi:predicted RNase H-like HicB family nuclease
MQPFVYPVTLTPEEQEGGFVVTFPDVPEAITQGDDVTDALRQATDCLEEAIAGHRSNWAAGHRRVRSQQRRLVQAGQAGGWRTATRLSSLLVHSFASRTFAVKRVTENTGKKPKGRR